MATFADYLNNLKPAIEALINKSYSDFKTAAKSDVDEFLKDAADDLERWTGLLADKSIDRDDFTLLARSAADLLALHALKQAGLAQARWDLFTNGVIDTVIKTAIATFI